MYSLGCIVWNMVTGAPPYYVEDLDALRDSLRFEVRDYLKSTSLFEGRSENLKDFVY